MIIKHDDAIKRLVDLSIDAGQSGMPLLESGCQLLLRAGKLTPRQRSDLAQAGHLILTCIGSDSRKRERT